MDKGANKISESLLQERFSAGIPKREASRDSFDSECKPFFMMMSSLNLSVDVVAGLYLPSLAPC